MTKNASVTHRRICGQPDEPIETPSVRPPPPRRPVASWSWRSSADVFAAVVGGGGWREWKLKLRWADVSAGVRLQVNGSAIRSPPQPPPKPRKAVAALEDSPHRPPSVLPPGIQRRGSSPAARPHSPALTEGHDTPRIDVQLVGKDRYSDIHYLFFRSQLSIIFL